jgi:hypothetical protein
MYSNPQPDPFPLVIDEAPTPSPFALSIVDEGDDQPSNFQVSNVI